MKSKVLLAVTVFVSMLFFTTLSTGETFISTPNEVGVNDRGNFIVENTEVSYFESNITISNSTGEQYTRSITGEKGVTSTKINFSNIGLATGSYKIEMTAKNSTENVSSFKSSDFEITTGSAGAEVIPLTSKSISSAECPLDKTNSMQKSCRMFGIELTKDMGSNLSDISASGQPLTASLSNGHYIGLVDEEKAGEYKTIFWDDDSTFREENETGNTEKSFLSPGETVKEFQVGEETLDLRPVISGNNIVLLTSPAPSEVPYRENDDISFTTMIYKTQDSSLGLNLDAEPINNRQVKIQSTNLRTGTVEEITPSDDTTNKYGFTGIGKVEEAEVGRNKVNVDNITSQFYEVSSFDINYEIQDGSGETKNTFKPGDDLTVEVNPTSNGQTINYDTIEIQVIDPSGNKETETLQNSKTASFTLPSDIKAGESTVSIKVTDSQGKTQSASTSFTVKKFRVHTIPLRETSYDGKTVPEPTETFAPNKTGYLFVSAVKLGTFGGVNEILGADFYNIDNPSTSEDECSQNVGDITGQISGENPLNITKTRSVNNSQIFSNLLSRIDNQGMKTQCVVKFETDENTTGIFSGEITSGRSSSNETQTGSVDFSISNYKMRGKTRDASGGRTWEFGNEQRVYIQPEITEIGTYNKISNSKIEDASIIGLEGSNSAAAKNVSFNESGNNYISFQAPDKAGYYEAKFLTEINTSNNQETETIKGNENFRVTVFDVNAQVSSPSRSWRTPSESNLTLDVTVETPSGNALQGVGLNITGIENGETEEEFLDKTSVQTNTTDSSGSAKLQITAPSNGWTEGWYRIKVNAEDSEGNTDVGREYFRVDEYNEQLTKYIDGQRCGYGCKPVKGDDVIINSTVTEVTGAVGGSRIGHQINLNESSLTYYGNGKTYSEEEVDITGHSQVQNDGTLKVQTGGLDSGRYEIKLKISLDNGDETTASERLSLAAFDLEVSKKGSQNGYQPGSNITYEFNASKSGNYTVKAQDFRGYNRETREFLELDPNLTKNLVETSYKEFNLSIPQGAAEAKYSGQIEVSANGSTQYERSGFQVKTLGVSIPENADLGYRDPLSREEDQFYNTNSTYPYPYDCAEMIGDSGFQFNQGDLTGDECSIINGSESYSTDLNVLWIDQSDYTSWNDSKVYMSYDKVFNQTGEVAVNTSINEETSNLESGLKYNITSIDDSSINVKPVNGYDTGREQILVEDTSGSYYYSSTSEERLRTDLNQDGDKEDKIYALAVNESGTFKTRLSLDTNLSQANSTVITQEGNGTLGSEKVYSGVYRNTTSTWENYRNNIFLTEPTESTYRSLRATIEAGQNYTFPVVVSYPNGTKVSNKQVNIDKIIRRSDSKTFGSSATATTGSDGIAFMDVTLPSLNESSTANFRVLPSITVDGETKKISRFSAPVVEVGKFSKEEAAYIERNVGQTRNYSNSTETKTVSHIENQEGITVKDEYSSTEYRYAQIQESFNSGCTDLNNDFDCGDKVSVLLYDNGFDSINGMNISEGVIDDDTTFGESYDNETAGNEEIIYNDYIFSNLSSISFSSGFGYGPDLLALFNETTDQLSLHKKKDQIPPQKSMQISLRFTELFGNSPIGGNVVVDSLAYNGDTYQVKNGVDFNKTMDSKGSVTFNISRTDFNGSSTDWPEGSLLSFKGEADGTPFKSTVEIEGGQ